MSLHSLGLRSITAMLGLALLPACSDVRPPPGDPLPPATGGVDTGNDTTSGSDTGREVADSTAGPTTTGVETETGGTCEPVTVPIVASDDPVGVIILVDNTPGMVEEATEVSLRLNQFHNLLSAQLETSIVLISAYPDEDPEGVCVGPPLGNGSCPSSDNNPPDYIHIDLPVTPLNAISHIFVTYDQWAGALPAGARRHLVAISRGDTGVSVGDFNESFLMLDPEANANYRFHASVGLTDCEEAGTTGNRFAALVDSTGGYLHDLCTQNYEVFFQALIGRILNDTGDRCRWEVPPIPEGVVFDSDYVELLLDVDGIMTSPPRVADEAACPAASTGWYWENPAAPTSMIACPDTCDLLLDFAVVQSFVRFGCAPEGEADSGG